MMSTSFCSCFLVGAIFIHILPVTRTLPAEINLGALFDDDDRGDDRLLRVMFAFVVDRLKESGADATVWRPRIETIPSSDSLKAYQKTCDLLLTPVVAVFGPKGGPATSQVQALCDSKEVPHVMTRPHRVVDDWAPTQFSVNLFPPQTAIGEALAAVVKHCSWTSMVVLYEESQGLIDLQELLSFSSHPNHPRISIRRMPEHGDYKPLLKDIKNSLLETRIVVHSRLDSSRKFIKQASNLLMTQQNYHYIFTHWDIYSLDMDNYKENGCNITAFRFVNDESSQAENLLYNFRQFLAKEKKHNIVLPTVGIETSVAVLYDSVNVIADAVHRFGPSLVPAMASCSSSQTWRNGTTFMNYIKLTELYGATGWIQFDNNGQRINYQVTILELTRNGFQELGKWHSASGLNVTRSFEKELEEATGSLENKTLRVTVILEEPFVMYKQTEQTLKGNDRYEGFCIDLLDEISKLRNFNYVIQEVKDQSYGAQDSTGKWNGMVGELQRGEADLAVASLTITYSRSEIIDFTVPFMHLGISILFKKPERKDPSLFTFLNPLSLDVWIYMIAAYVGVSLMLWILARFSPYEWYNPHPCNPDTDIVENQFTLVNSFWFTVGSLMQQGSDLTPRACSTRVVAGIWWLFTLILISSYTANLAAFLTVQRMVSPIDNADDLSKQSKIAYGSLGRGSTTTFFKESKIQTYERMWNVMSKAEPSAFVNSSREGIARVKKGDYAYLMESSMLEYYIERDCELMKIGGLLDSKGYGIGLPKGSKYREPISSAILRLQEKTKTTELKQRWWKERRGGGQCTGDASKKSGHNELGLRNVGGVFVLLLGGMVIAFLIAIVEFLHKAKKNAELDKRSLGSEMWQEIQFAMRCHGSKKPVRRRSVGTYLQDGTDRSLDGGFANAYSAGYSAVPTKGDQFVYNINDALN